MFQHLKNFFHYGISIFMYSILLVLVLVLVTFISYVREKQHTLEGSTISPLFSAYVIVSESMEPIIQVEDGVIDRKIDSSDIQIGDVITFISNDPVSSGKVITHRVIGKYQTADGVYQYRTKGDNNRNSDRFIVSENQVLGKVMFRIPKLGSLRNFLLTSYGWLLLIVFPCLVIVVIDVVKIVSKLIRNTKNKKQMTM